MKSPSFSGRAFAVRAPAGLMLAVVAFHLAMTRQAQLLPWYGGGFGMFSTSNRPWNEGFFCEAGDAQGRLYTIAWNPPYPAPGPFDGAFKADLLGAPTRGALETAAQVILHAKLSPAEINQAQVIAALDHAGLLSRIAFRRPLQDLASLHALATSDSAIDPSGINPLVWVRVSVWRLHFDPAQTAVVPEPAGAPVEVRRAP